MSTNFYAELDLLDSFVEITDPQRFVAVPESWHVIVTDVKGSTQAIADGRYKEVNMLGASSIVVILNCAGAIDVPFVFGGDGATLLIPDALLVPARRALLGLRELAERDFDLELRIGIVPVRDLVAAGAPTWIAKFKVSEHYQQAVFSGGGLALAEKLVKDPASAPRYQVEAHGLTPAADFTGLECRWQDIPSRRGETVSLLVMACTPDADRNNAIYREVLGTIETVYGSDVDYNPIAVEALRPAFSPRRLIQETRFRAGAGALRRARYLAEIWFRNILLKVFVRFKLRVDGTQWERYPELVTHTSDYKKYDDTLRMVIAGGPQQREQLERYLEQRYRDGELVYGLHISNRAVMTCLVFERMGRQVHFVDGADGGYALAARALKGRLKERPAAAA